MQTHPVTPVSSKDKTKTVLATEQSPPNSPQPPECPEKRPRFRMAAEHRIDVRRQQASAERALAASDSSARAAPVNGQAGISYQGSFSLALYTNRNCLSFSSRLSHFSRSIHASLAIPHSRRHVRRPCAQPSAIHHCIIAYRAHAAARRLPRIFC